MKKFVAMLLAGVMVFSLAGCGSSSSSASDYEEMEWPTSGLATMLPTPESTVGEISTNDDDLFSVDVGETSEEQFSDYVDACKEVGFTEDVTETSDSYFAQTEDGYDLDLLYFEDDEYMSIRLEAPEELGELEWPTTGLATMLPTPESSTGKIDKDSSDHFKAYIGFESTDEYDSYVTACQDMGYDVDYDKGDDSYDAYNESGYELDIDLYEYKGYFLVEIQAPDDAQETDDTKEVEETESENEAEPESEDTSSESSNRSGISDEFQQAMDSYEEFIDEYVAFMEEYTDSDYSADMLDDYLDYMDKYDQAMEDFEAIEDDDMTDEELDLYIDVQTRTLEKLSSIEY